MDVSNLYVPDTSKWLQFYKDTSKQFMRNIKKGQFGGSIAKGKQSNITPIEWKKNPKSKMEISDVPVNIISPSKAVVLQAQSEVKRKINMNRGLKRKRRSDKTKQKGKRRKIVVKKRRVGNKNSKTKHNRVKKQKKKTSSDIFG